MHGLPMLAPKWPAGPKVTAPMPLAAQSLHHCCWKLACHVFLVGLSGPSALLTPSHVLSGPPCVWAVHETTGCGYDPAASCAGHASPCCHHLCSLAICRACTQHEAAHVSGCMLHPCDRTHTCFTSLYMTVCTSTELATNMPCLQHHMMIVQGRNQVHPCTTHVMPTDSAMAPTCLSSDSSSAAGAGSLP